MAKLEILVEKRRHLDKEDAISVIKEYASDIFNAYYDALVKFNSEITQTRNPEARTRLASVLLNAKMVDSFIDAFPDSYTKRKYGRVIFRFEGMLMMIKKLDGDGKPSYIPTLLSNSILSQEQTSLFKDDEAARQEPLIFFGYTKDKSGDYVNPRIVYYDNEVKWVISTQDFMLNANVKDTAQKIVVKRKKRSEGESSAS